jgi:hypothetical protein
MFLNADSARIIWLLSMVEKYIAHIPLLNIVGVHSNVYFFIA